MPVNDTRHSILREGAHQERADFCACILWGVVDSVFNVLIGDNALYLSMFLKCVIESTFDINVMVFKVLTFNPRVIPIQFFLLNESFKEPFFRGPINAGDDALPIALKIVKDGFPCRKHPIRFFVPFGDKGLNEIEVLSL